MSEEAKTSEWFTKMYQELEGTPDYIAAGFAIEIMEAMWVQAQSVGKSQADIARELGLNRAYISRVFSGSENLTLKTIARLAAAVGKRPVLTLKFI